MLDRYCQNGHPIIVWQNNEMKDCPICASRKKGAAMLGETDLGGYDMYEINDCKEEQNKEPRNNEEPTNDRSIIP